MEKRSFRCLRRGISALALVAAAPGCEPGGEAPLAPRVAPGYVLFAPLLSTSTYLVDREGRVVHTWSSALGPGASVDLLEDGSLLRPARQPGPQRFHDGGVGGRIQRFAWDGTLLWDWVLASERWIQHHDVEALPNGDVLLLAWEHKSREQALRAGRDPRRVGAGGLWPECVVEVRPLPPDGGEIVWEWHAWDHRVQDRDPRLPAHGEIAAHPEAIDVNGGRGPEGWDQALLARLRALGYAGGAGTPADVEPDFMHANSVAYHPALDQIVLSVSAFNEIWIVDHGTTTSEAAGVRGGRVGRGGGLLYRWGNPRAYGRGGEADRRLFGQHDARWIPPGLPGAGHLLAFNNGYGGPAGMGSSVVEIEPPLAPDGSYLLPRGARYGPAAPSWEYRGHPPSSFTADFLSGAQRLADGNTLVTAGPQGRIFEVDSRGTVVWEYTNPFSGGAPNPAGDPPRALFRAVFVASDHPALAGRELRPLDPQPGSEDR